MTALQGIAAALIVISFHFFSATLILYFVKGVLREHSLDLGVLNFQFNKVLVATSIGAAILEIVGILILALQA